MDTEILYKAEGEFPDNVYGPDENGWYWQEWVDFSGTPYWRAWPLHGDPGHDPYQPDSKSTFSSSNTIKGSD